MALELSSLAFLLFIVVFSLVIIGFALYLIRNYCQRHLRGSKGSTSEQKRQTSHLDIEGLKTTTDDESTMRLHTLEQILKQEEKTMFDQGKSLSLTAVKLQGQNQSSINNHPKESPSPKEKSIKH